MSIQKSDKSAEHTVTIKFQPRQAAPPSLFIIPAIPNEDTY